EAAGMAGELSEADLERMNRTGVRPITEAQGLALFDTAGALRDPALVPIDLDLKALRTSLTTSGEELPSLFRGLIRTTTRRATSAGAKADSGALLRRLEGLDESAQEKLLLGLILEHAAAVLGHSSADAVDAEKDFLETGFDSLSAMELRATLNTVTGLGLPPMVVFDNKTPTGLARFLREACRSAAEGREQTPQTGPDGAGGAEQDTVSGLFRSGVIAGQTTKAFNLLRAVADLRPTFDSYADLGAPLAPVKLADGPERPRLICLSTPMATGGVHQHARLAAHFRDVRQLSTLPTPGFRSGERLPADVDALTAVLAESVLQAAEGEPFVLLGYSSGGVLTYGTAARLERDFGTQAAGVVLVDTYRVTEEAGGGMQARVFEQMSGALVDRDSEFGLFDSTGLSAMRAYFDLLPRFDLTGVAAPVLFVGAGQSFLTDAGTGTDADTGAETTAGTDAGTGADPDDGAWRAQPWDPEHQYVTVPATHFSIVEEHAEHTARTVQEWIRGLTPAAPSTPDVPDAYLSNER
ncbi:thioesterase domain-containing protein, partial [Streptomyces monticola]